MGKDGRSNKRGEGYNDRESRKAQVSATIRASKEIAELPKNDNWKTDGEYVQTVVEHVLSICERYGLLPTVTHIAAALGVPRDIEYDVRMGYLRANPDVVSALQGYYTVCESATVASTLDGGTNNIAGIFLLKSQYGYKEEPREVVVTHNKLLGERKDPAAIAARYAEAMVVDSTELKAVEDKESDDGLVSDPECEF